MTLDELIAIAKGLLGNNLVTLLVAGFGAYFGAYLKKKADNKAIHEDIGKLVDQVKAVTTATKEIEAKVSDDYWGKQRRWDLQRDTLLAVIDAIGKFQGDTNQIIAMRPVLMGLPPGHENAEVMNEKLNTIRLSLIEQASGLMTLSYRVALVSSANVQKAVTELHRVLMASQEVMRNDDFAKAMAFASNAEQATLRTLAAIRVELGFPDLSPTPQSSGS